MFIRKKGNHYSGIWISDLRWTMPPLSDPTAIYEVADHDGKVAVNGGLFEQVPDDEVTTYFRTEHPDLKSRKWRHGLPDVHGWVWVSKST